MITEEDIEHITQVVVKRQKMDVTYLTKTQENSIHRQLKSIGQLQNVDNIRKVVDEAQEYAFNVIMIQNNFDKDCFKLVRDHDSLFFRRWNKEYIMTREWENENHDKWEEIMKRYLRIFEKTLRNKLKKNLLKKHLEQDDG